MAYLPGQLYAKTSGGVWTPVGYGASDVAVPISNTGAVMGTASSGAVSATGALGTISGAANATNQVVVSVATAGSGVIALTGGTYTALTLAFEASMDPAGAAASWFPIEAVRADGSAVETFATFTAAATRVWRVPACWALVRVRVHAITKSADPTLTITPDGATVDPSPAVLMNPLASLQGPSANPGSLPAPAYVSVAVNTATSVVAAPGAGLSIYVTDMEGSNAAGTATRVDWTEGSGGTVKYSRHMAASGGGYVTNLKTPWKLPANTALFLIQSAANQCYHTANYYVAP